MTSASSTSLSSATGCSSSAPYLAMAALLMSTSILPAYEHLMGIENAKRC